jgi:hypothetical protein
MSWEEAARQSIESGAVALERISDRELIDAWVDTVGAFADPASGERRDLEEALCDATRLSAPALQAGLEAVLGGVTGTHVEALVERAGGRRNRSPLLVVLSGNIPGLVVQPLLPALALRRPTVLKTARGEPIFTPAFVAALVRRLPALAGGVSVRSWRGGLGAVGVESIESEESYWLEQATTVVAYGGAEAIDGLRRRTAGQLLDYGPKLSLGLVGDSSSPFRYSAGIARDIALFEQQGCLSIQALFVLGDPLPWAEAVRCELELLAIAWPPPELPVAVAASVHALRAEARMRGLWVGEQPLRHGTVVVEEADAPLRPSPGGRSVRLYPVATSSEVLGRLEGWKGQLQGVALAVPEAGSLALGLEALGVSRLASPGDLQSPDVSWQNGGRDLLEELACSTN